MGKVKPTLFAISTVFMIVYFVFFDAFFGFARSSAHNWFWVSKFFVSTVIISVACLGGLSLDFLLSKLS